MKYLVAVLVFILRCIPDLAMIYFGFCVALVGLKVFRAEVLQVDMVVIILLWFSAGQAASYIDDRLMDRRLIRAYDAGRFDAADTSGMSFRRSNL